MYLNIDNLIFSYLQKQQPIPNLTLFDRFYGNHSKKLRVVQYIPLRNQGSPDHQQALNCISDFKLAYIKAKIQEIYSNDIVLKNPSKYQETGLSSDLEISCSLQLNLVELDRFKEYPLGVLVTVDTQNYLRMHTLNQESSELIASQRLSIEENDKVISVHFFIKAKSLIISTDKGQCFIVTCERDLSE